MIHHTAPHIPFRPAESWNAAEAQLAGTVHCDFPKWYASFLAALLYHRRQATMKP